MHIQSGRTNSCCRSELLANPELYSRGELRVLSPLWRAESSVSRGELRVLSPLWRAESGRAAGPAMSGESYMESDFYSDSAYTADISTKMRVPDRLTAHGALAGSGQLLPEVCEHSHP